VETHARPLRDRKDTSRTMTDSPYSAAVFDIDGTQLDTLADIGNAPGANRGVRAVPPRGGMYLMLDIRETGLSGNEFATRLLDAERIAVMPGESFGNAAAGHLRVALTVPEADLRDALGRIAAFASGLV
jgi:aspartate/methionine/tyrosine aminotransferase